MVVGRMHALDKFQYFTMKTGICSFLGLCNVYRQFVPEFSKLAVLLNKKLRKEEPTTFPTLVYAEIKSFDALKNVVTNTPILVLSRTNSQYALGAHACDTQV